VFVCDLCGYRKVVRARQRLARHEAGKDYEVEVLADPFWYRQTSYLPRKPGQRALRYSATYRYCETRSDAEQYGRRLHTAGYHYRVNEYDERID
jgi:hypothetical protein